MIPSPGVEILHVTHASNVSAVPTAAGPARLLETGIGEAVADAGVDIDVVEISPPESVLGEVGTSFAVYDRISEEVRRARGRDRLAVVLASSCGAAIGAVSGMARGDRGALWLDRHGDFNTPETTESGLLDGTTLASLTGRCWGTMCSNVRGYEVVGDGDVVWRPSPSPRTIRRSTTTLAWLESELRHCGWLPKPGGDEATTRARREGLHGRRGSTGCSRLATACSPTRLPSSVPTSES